MIGSSDQPADPGTASAPAPTRLSPWAILFGVLVDFVGSLLAALPFAAVAGEDHPGWLPIGLAFTALGGFTAAAVAGRRSVAHGAWVGVVSMLIGAALSLNDPPPVPLWYSILGYGLTVPAAAGGGWLNRRLRGERQAADAGDTAVYPSMAQAVALLVVTIVIANGTIFAAGFLASFGPGDRSALRPWFPLLLIAAAVLGYGAILLLAVRRAGAPRGLLFPFWRPRAPVFWSAVATVVGVSIVLAVVLRTIIEGLDVEARSANPIPLGGLDPGTWALTIIFVLIAPPAEEMLFRGVILRGFASRYTPRKAVTASAVLFGLVHINPFQLLPAMFLGGLFGWWRLRTGSLTLPVLGHALNNALALAALTTRAWEQLPGWMAALGGGLAVGGMVLFARVSRVPEVAAG